MIYTVILNPALDKTVEIPGMALDTVNRITEMRTDPGGKGINVSKVIAKLGGESCAAGILGGGSGKMLEKLLEGEPFATRFRFVEGQTRTNLKIIDREGHTNTDINEPGLTVTDADLDALLHELLAELRPGDIVVLAGSLPKGAPQDTYRTWTAACKKAGARVFLDADGALLAEGLKAAPYLIKPNDDELSRLAGKKLPRGTDRRGQKAARARHRTGRDLARRPRRALSAKGQHDLRRGPQGSGRQYGRCG